MQHKHYINVTVASGGNVSEEFDSWGGDGELTLIGMEVPVLDASSAFIAFKGSHVAGGSPTIVYDAAGNVVGSVVAQTPGRCVQVEYEELRAFRYLTLRVMQSDKTTDQNQTADRTITLIFDKV